MATPSQVRTFFLGVPSGHSPPRNTIAQRSATVAKMFNIFFMVDKFSMKTIPHLTAKDGSVKLVIVLNLRSVRIMVEGVVLEKPHLGCVFHLPLRVSTA